MDYLRQGIHLRGYAQKDYRHEYKREAFELFSAMLDRVKFETASLLSKIEVLRDLESRVRELMTAHIEKRPLWFPHDLLGPRPDQDPDRHVAELRRRAEGIPDPARAALSLNMLTEEGLPHFHRLLAVHLGDDSHWREWNNLWTAEEDRHGVILHDYIRETPRSMQA